MAAATGIFGTVVGTLATHTGAVVPGMRVPQVSFAP